MSSGSSIHQDEYVIESVWLGRISGEPMIVHTLGDRFPWNGSTIGSIEAELEAGGLVFLRLVSTNGKTLLRKILGPDDCLIYADNRHLS